MDETLALAKFCIGRHRRLMMICLLAIAVSSVGALLSSMLMPSSWGASTGIFILFVTYLPAIFASIALFDYGGMSELMAGESGCSHWILRMPIRSWKIALVPVVLKSLWVALIWCVFMVSWNAIREFDWRLSYLLFACVAIAAGANWLAAISWRPYTNGWWRIVALGTFCLLSYGIMISLLIVAENNQHHSTAVKSYASLLRAWLPILSIVASIVSYVASVVFAYRAIAIARTQSQGLIGEAESKWSAADQATSERRERSHASPLRGLIWFLFARSRSWIARSTVVLIGGLLLGALCFPFHILSVIAVFLWVIYIAGIGVTQGEGNHGKKLKFKTNMTPILAQSPLSTATIAWTRVSVHAATMAGLMSLSLITYLGWVLWPSNREAWLKWATQAATSVGWQGDPIWIGMRWSIAIVVGVNAWLLFRWITLNWIGYSGRESWTIALTIGYGVAFFIVFGILFRWFIANASDWDTVKASAYYWLQYLPHVFCMGLVIKLIMTIASVVWLAGCDLASNRAIILVFAIWTFIAFGLGLGIWLLIPDPRATWYWCLATAVLSTPLARILILPVMLDLNRVR